MSADTLDNRIKALKNKREILLAQKAEKVARLKSAQEDLKTLRDEAAEMGYDLKDIATILESKKIEMEDLVSAAEKAMQEAEEKLAKYEE